MILIQGKSTEKLSIDDIKNVFNKMIDTVENFEHGRIDKYNDKLKSIYLNRYDDISDDKNIELILCTKTIISDSMINEFELYKDNGKPSNYKLSIYDAEDIEKRIITSLQGDEFVQKDKIELCETNNQLNYNGGLIVNVKASSLKKLYLKHGEKGLFSFNLREHISQKNVDDGIDETIKKENYNFWFYNNGITIGCDDYSVDGDNIKLYNFSIINGAQTTTKLGRSKIVDQNNDFAVVCKIVKANGSLQNSSDFISKISEASNSQKPIRARDLKANSIEQKKLQISSADNRFPLSIEIKRGVKPSNDRKVERWQKVTNEYVGQLILACLLQKPGTARSGKAAIFTSDKIYNNVYKRKHDYDTLYDIVKIGNIYENFKLDYLKNETDTKKIAVSQNGKFTVLAIIFYLYKRIYCRVEDFTDLKVMDDNINGKLTLNYKCDDYEQKLHYLFKFIVKVLSDLYDVKVNELKLTSYSNFFKTDKTYIEVILNEIDRLLSDSYDYERIEKHMDIFQEKV